MKDMVFIDLETTGLNPAECSILEIGIALVTPDWVVKDFAAIPVCSDQAWFEISTGTLSSFIKKMHGAGGSGLIPLIESVHAQNPTSLLPHVVEDAVLNLISNWDINKKTPVYGSSVGFDRKFLEQHMPRIQDTFHYRVVDSSGDMEFIKNRYPLLWKAIDNDPTKRPENLSTRHTVMEDIMHSIDLQRRLDKHVFMIADAHRQMIRQATVSLPDYSAAEGSYTDD